MDPDDVFENSSGGYIIYGNPGEERELQLAAMAFWHIFDCFEVVPKIDDEDDTYGYSGFMRQWWPRAEYKYFLRRDTYPVGSTWCYVNYTRNDMLVVSFEPYNDITTNQIFTKVMEYASDKNDTFILSRESKYYNNWLKKTFDILELHKGDIVGIPNNFPILPKMPRIIQPEWKYRPLWNPTQISFTFYSNKKYKRNILKLARMYWAIYQAYAPTLKGIELTDIQLEASMNTYEDIYCTANMEGDQDEPYSTAKYWCSVNLARSNGVPEIVTNFTPMHISDKTIQNDIVEEFDDNYTFDGYESSKHVDWLYTIGKNMELTSSRTWTFETFTHICTGAPNWRKFRGIPPGCPVECTIRQV